MGSVFLCKRLKEKSVTVSREREGIDMKSILTIIKGENPKFIIVLIMVMLMIAGCTQKPNSLAPTVANSPQVEKNEQQENENSPQNIKFKYRQGTEAFTIKPRENGAKLEAADGKKLARFTKAGSGKFKIKNATDGISGYVTIEPGVWTLKNLEDNKVLYILRSQKDGTYKLETAANKEIYQVQVKESGWEIKTTENGLIYKIKDKDKKISLTNSKDEVLIYTKANILPIVVACFGFDILTKEQQAALAYAVNLSENK
jgi:hypothetical protein